MKKSTLEKMRKIIKGSTAAFYIILVFDIICLACFAALYIKHNAVIFITGIIACIISIIAAITCLILERKI